MSYIPYVALVWGQLLTILVLKSEKVLLYYVLTCLKWSWMSGKYSTQIRHHFLQPLIWIYTVCSGLSVPIFRNIIYSIFIAPDIGIILVIILGPVVQNINSLTSSLVVKMLTVLVSIIANSRVFLLKKCE